MRSSTITYFGKTNARDQSKVFGIKPDDRRRHMYVIGKTGTGKSTLLERMAFQDIENGHGLAFIDPHGDSAEKLARAVPPERIQDLVYFNPSDLAYPIGFNILENNDPDLRSVIASGVVGVFHKLWKDSWGPRLENVLRHAVLSLLNSPNATLLAVLRLLLDEKYRLQIINSERDPIIRLFWEKQFAGYSDRFRVEVIEPVQNKISHFSTNPLVRNIIGQPRSGFNLRELMDQKKILIVNLAKGRIGEDVSSLLGALLITKIQLTALSRADIPEAKRTDFYLYVDEFQNFATESFANILAEARKYRLNLILAHQYMEQLEETVQSAVFGNVGTLAMFRLGARDVEVLEKEVRPTLNAQDLLHLPKYQIYVRLMVDGVATEPFSALTLKPLEVSQQEKAINASRDRYGTPRHVVEKKINRWAGVMSGNTKTETGGGEGAPKRKRSRQKSKIRNYRTVCSACGQSTQLSFQPTEKRPVFCSQCFRDYQRKRDSKTG